MLMTKTYLWSVANKLIRENGFSIMQLKDESGTVLESSSISLIKNDKMDYLFIRLIPVEYIWPNHLLKELQNSTQTANQIRQQLLSRRMYNLNLYVFQSTPSDEVIQIISDGATSSDKKLDLFFGFADLEKEQIGLPESTFKSLGITKEPFVYYFTHPAPEDFSVLREEIKEVEQTRRKALASIFNYGKPIFTYLLIFINSLLFLLMTYRGGSTNIEVLLNFGAKETFLISIGEYWRLVSPIFLHIGFLHFFLNNLALYFLGQMTEKIFGSIRFLTIYLFAGIFGNVFSLLFSPSSIGAGASGAIYGLFGALLYFGYIYPDLFFRTMGRNVITIIGINLVFSIVVPSVDVYAHLGGLLGGFAIASLVLLPKQEKLKKAAAALSVVFVLLMFISVWWTITDRDIKGSNEIYFTGLTALEQGDLGKAELIFGHLAENYYNVPSYHFFYAGIAFEQGNFSRAIEEYQITLELEPKFPYANYNLALINKINDDYITAKEYLERELEVNPKNLDALNLLKQVNSAIQP